MDVPNLPLSNNENQAHNDMIISSYNVRIGCKSKHLNKNSHFIDFISFFSIPSKIDNELFCSLYKKHQLSARQIAEKIGVCKATVLKRLKESNVSCRKKGASSNLQNYLCSNPPFGFKVVDGRLTKNPLEVRICRKIVDMKNKGYSFIAIGQTLEKEGFKNRRGSISWHNTFVGKVYNRWYKKVQPKGV